MKTIEKKKESAEALDEIAVAKRFIEHGKLLLRAGHTRKAALYAERLHIQIELIRALVAATVVAGAAKAAEGDVIRLQDELDILKERYRSLFLELHGEELTGAFPPITEQGR